MVQTRDVTVSESALLFGIFLVFPLCKWPSLYGERPLKKMVSPILEKKTVRDENEVSNTESALWLSISGIRI